MAIISDPRMVRQGDSRRPHTKRGESILGSLLLRFDHNGTVSVYPNTDDPERLADQFAELVALFLSQPGLMLAACGLSEKDPE